jgi:peptidyl-prolyl cis-trans isomerase A (cyclophilin A)
MKRALLAAVLVAVIVVGVAGATGGPSLSNPSSLHKAAPAVFKAKFRTTQGPFVITVHRSWAPIGAKRFYNLVYYHYYDNQPLFRVLTHYVAQWGIYMKPPIAKAWKTAYIKDETATQKNSRGKVTFALSSAKNSRTTQIFVNLRSNSFAGRFAPFGEVTRGLSVFGKFYHGYGEYPSNNQAGMIKYGGWWVHKYFPKLDWIKTARIVP